MCSAYRSFSSLILCFRSFDASICICWNSQKLNEQKLMDEFFFCLFVYTLTLTKSKSSWKEWWRMDINDVTDVRIFFCRLMVSFKRVNHIYIMFNWRIKWTLNSILFYPSILLCYLFLWLHLKIDLSFHFISTNKQID